MFVAQSQLMNQAFNCVTISKTQIWTREKAIEVIVRFLTDEILYPEADQALNWLEDEYPISRPAIRRLRCCILFEEFFEYEHQIVVMASCLRQLKLSLR